MSVKQFVANLNARKRELKEQRRDATDEQKAVEKRIEKIDAELLEIKQVVLKARRKTIEA